MKASHLKKNNITWIPEKNDLAGRVLLVLGARLEKVQGHDHGVDPVPLHASALDMLSK